jgi:GNAT superfamily N-acetyltransferase
MSAAVSLCPAFTLRPARDADVPFIVKPWLQQLRDEVSTRFINDRVFFQRHGALVQQLLKESTTIIAYDANDPDHLYGFACGSDRAVHWVYVKGAFRGMGLGRALLERLIGASVGATDIPCSHASHLFNDRKFVARYRLAYDPYVLMEW